MQRKTLLATVLVLAVIGAASLVIAQDGAPSAPPAKNPAGKTEPMAHDGMADFMGGPDFGGPGPGPGFGRPGFGRMGFDAPESPVIGDLTALERLYRESGRTKELPALYNDVLSKSQDPRVRTYAYHQLARVQSAPASTDQAIATLRKSLDENLSNEAKKRAELDKMRSDWEQRHSQTKPAPQS
ncbi:MULTISPECIES: hypothetical protein [unclassified Dyella]|uniref:hypothetical protein n=1 Tax=unclassified Dyella TaxID=2634549 RepID=UPI000C8240BE|nr:MULTISPECIES: hypothetical protein [unclassified Dyella]MDR3444809.1 hypothetical protein [Dyella sp.]PMQ06126.1 hypothetical protein DyAD56_07685 [Dyella sp. AD56]